MVLPKRRIVNVSVQQQLYVQFNGIVRFSPLDLGRAALQDSRVADSPGMSAVPRMAAALLRAAAAALDMDVGGVSKL